MNIISQHPVLGVFTTTPKILNQADLKKSIMAEGIVHKETNLVELEKDITCAVCQEHYTEPKVLPCLHYYCKKCILNLALRRGTNQRFPCPECRKETTLPEGSVEELKTAFFVHRLKDMYSTVERVHGNVAVKCEGCTDSGDKAEAFCRQCAVFICKECIKQHKRMKAFASHEVDSLEDLKQGRAREIAVKEPPIKKCNTHEEPLMVYCFDCNSLICRDCTVTAHRDHRFEFSKVAAPNTKKKLLEELDPLRELSASLSHAVEEVQTTKQEVEAQGEAVANSIQTSFDELHKILENRKQKLLHKAKVIVQEKSDKLLMQEKNLSLAKTEVQSVLDYTAGFVSHCSDNEVMSMQAEITSRIKHEIEEHGKADGTIEPVEEADVGVEVVRFAEDLQQLCQTQAMIIALPVVRTVEISPVNQVQSLCEATLIATFSNSYSLKKKIDVKSHIKSLSNKDVISCDVDQTSAGRYSIKYTPTVRGRHELTVLVNGQQVAGSPFLVFVSIPPTQLGKPVKVFNNIKSPVGVAVNSIGELVVTEQNGDIIKFDKEAKQKVFVKHLVSQLSALDGVAADDEDNIYCVDEESGKILKCDKDGGNIQVHEVKQVKGPGHTGLTVLREEVMVCERKNRGTVMVYDRELKYVRRIEHGDLGEFCDVSADCHGNLYVVDCTNLCIQVFSNEGVFLRSFGCDINKMNLFKEPANVCVSGQHVFVSDWNCKTDSSVFVFTVAGDYVTSFGWYGGEESQFNAPCCICIDKDGFIFVADYGNDRVQCF